jgi:CubicO group peptidase (beta-lactamase class C family)
MKNYLLLYFLLIIIEAKSQNLIFGTIISQESKQPIELVTVGIASKGIGTNTNAEGKFQLYILNSHQHDTVQFSMIGYETQKILVSNLVGKDNTIFLEPKIYSLGEITVKAKRLTANDIMRLVIQNKTKNYNEKPFKLDAYYREIRNVNGKYDHLIEVALNTYGKGINQYHQTIELVNSRKIDHERFVHEENLLNSTLRLDYIANSEGIKLSNFKKNNYKFENIAFEGDKNIYVISSGNYPDRKYTFYINEEDFSIIRLEMEDWYAERGKLYLAPIDKTHLFRLRYFKVVNIYKPHQHKYYPDHISVLWNYDKYNTSTKSVYENSSWLREFKVNQIITQEIGQPDLAKVMSKFGSKIEDQMTQYDAEFWKNYNTIPLTSKVITDLESKGALEDQFIKNGSQARKRKKFSCEKESGLEKVICLLRNYHELYEIPASQIAVAINDNLVISEALGYADLETKTKATTQTPFRIASISKTLTAVCAMQLKEKGLLDLDKSIQNYVPSFPSKKWEITSRHLLNNTSGIRHYLDNDDFYRNKQYNSMTEAIEIFKNDSLLFQPNKSSQYSSFGFNLLGAVIEGVSQTHYLSYLYKNIFSPLQMNSSYGERNDSFKIPQESNYYISKEGQKIKEPLQNLSYKWSSGGITSTAEDLAKFGIGLLRGSILKRETFQLFLNPQLLFNNEGTGYSLGWFIDTDQEGKIMLHHAGTAPAYSSHLLIYPSKGIVIAYLANTGTDTFFDKDFADEMIKIIERK